MKKLYIIGPSDGRDGSYYLLNEDGFCMANHFCSNYSFAKSDLIQGRPERLEKWKDYLSDGYSLEIADDKIKSNLLKLNQVFSDTEYLNKYSEENKL